MNCSTHATVAATRQCTQCHRLLCDACMREVKAGTEAIAVCQRCNGVAGALPAIVPVGPIAVAELLARPFAYEGLFTAATLGVVKWLQLGVAQLPGGGAAGGVLAAIYTAGLVAFYFRVIAHIGDDLPGLPGASDAVDSPGEVASQGLRGLLCLIVGHAPLIAWWLLRDSDAALRPVDGVIAVALLLVGLSYMPAVLLTIVLTNSTAGALWPPAWIKVMTTAPSSYARLALLFAASNAAIVLALFILGLIARIPFVGGLIFGTGEALLFFCQACLVGGFLRRHADDFGY